MAREDIADFEIWADSRHAMNNANSYDSKTSSYNPGFVNPPHWVIRMDAWNGLQKFMKDQEPGFLPLMIDPAESFQNPQIVDPGNGFRLPEEVISYDWSIRNDDGSFREERQSHRSKFGDGKERVITQMDFNVPELDTYVVNLTVRFKDGTVENQAKSITLRDFLVISIGDSFSAGQGNPDKPGLTTVASQVKCEQSPTISKALELDIDLKDEVRWQEPKAYRSYNSAPSMAARNLEVEWRSKRQNAGDMITFLTFARSGSTIVDGLVGPKDDTIDAGQIDEIKRTIGNRKIDALIISIGGNDVGFAPTLENLVKGDAIWEIGNDKANRDQIIADVKFKITALPNLYLVLAGFIGQLEVDARDVYLIEYPITLFEKTDASGEPFVDEGCEMFSGPDLDLSKADAKAVTDVGRDLNAAVKAAADQHNWRYVGGVVDRYRGRGYCAGSDRLFVTATESCLNQGDFEGMAHPNSKGHSIIAELIAEKVDNLSLHPVTEGQKLVSGTGTVGGSLG